MILECSWIYREVQIPFGDRYLNNFSPRRVPASARTTKGKSQRDHSQRIWHVSSAEARHGPKSQTDTQNQPLGIGTSRDFPNA